MTASSRGWALVFRVSYRLIRLGAPAIRAVLGAIPALLPRIVELEVVGVRSGRRRSVPLTLLTVDGRRYVGHPNGEAPWTRNLEAGGGVLVTRGRPGSRERVRGLRLVPGPEREAVVRATWSEQPFPSNLLYRAARHHVRRVGVYLRLEPADATE